VTCYCLYAILLNVSMSEDDCIAFLQAIRWENKPVCPYCQSPKCCPIQNHRFHCNTCNTAFSVTAQTLFHQTRLPLIKWFEAIAFVLKSSNHVSSRMLAITISVNRHTGYRILQRIDMALLDPTQRDLLYNIYSQSKEDNNA
jgi:transposase-like protein